jgi:hypothetical protein
VNEEALAPWGAVAPITNKRIQGIINLATDLYITFLCSVCETLEVIAVHVDKGVVIKRWA